MSEDNALTLRYTELAKQPGCVVDPATLRQRMNRGWPLIDAMRTPPGQVRNFAEYRAPVTDPVPSRTYVNASNPSGSYVPVKWNVRDGGENHLRIKSLSPFAHEDSPA